MEKSIFDLLDYRYDLFASRFDSCHIFRCYLIIFGTKYAANTGVICHFMTSHIHKYLFLSVFFATIISCKDRKTDSQNQNTSARTKQHEVGLKYVITLPNNYKVVDYRGVDYVDYGFVPIDTSNNIAPTAGIIFGSNVGCKESIYGTDILRDTLPSDLLDNQVNWIRYKIDSLYIAEAFVNEEFCAEINALQKNQVDSFITIFKTMKRK